LRAEVAAVVETVNTSVPEPLTDEDAREHVAGSLAAAGLTEQLRLTAPVNPLTAATVIVEVLPVVAPGATVMLPLFFRVKLWAAAAVTVTLTVVLDVIVPEVPDTVIA
jgi:hypothetical protein